ncbi:cutinase family protein [Nocardioides houyundeii]|uniref:cutinase family protein n=1 Tax=Nocardioides houyundeii TaxID=2045452 RepID=UPI000DF16C9E|nr:cutinase family protein [Nocardioides houyundeii]
MTRAPWSLRSLASVSRSATRATVARAVTACVLGSVLLVVADQQGAEVAPLPEVERSAASTCTDVLVVGIDGNGQGRKAKYGAVVAKVANKVTARATAQNRSVTTSRIRVGTPANTVLKGGRKAGTPATKAVSKKQLRRWKAPVSAGVKKTRTLLAKRMASCPEQQVLLVGYAQGAAVAHLVSQKLDKAGKLGNVAGVVLVSDPYRVPKSSAGRPLGKPSAGNGSKGVIARFGKSVGDVPGSVPTFRAISVCHRADLVCNPRRTKVGKALKVSGSYHKGASKAVLRQAADAAWKQLSLWPDPVEQQLMVAAGEPISVQLQATGGSPVAPAVRWAPVSVPTGLTLSETGLLSGELPSSGIYEVSFTVAGTSPATTARSGKVLLNARAASGALSAGGQSTCEVRVDGSAWCWGRNDFGQLGDGTNTLRVSPAQVAGSGWARVATGGSFTCGVKTDGTLWCWGLNNFGQLGGTDKTSSNLPRQVGTGATWREVSASWGHACATQADGSMWCWGQNSRGQLGNGKTSSRSTPLRVLGDQQWTGVTAGGWHTCGTAGDGSAWCWGENTFGEVGDGTTTLRVRPQRVKGEGSFTQLSATWGRTCGVLVDGGLRCWGDNASGGIGDGTYADRSNPVSVAGGNGSWAQVATSLAGACATERSGAVWCWGDNRYGQLGPATSTSSTVPVPAGVTSVGGAVAAGWMHACALSTAGPTCWGANDQGQLGNGVQAVAAMPTAPRPTWVAPTPLTNQQVKQWGAKRIATAGIAGRPAVSARLASRKAASFNIMSFNVLGSQHTAPTGGRPAFAPGRVRTEWAKQVISARDASLIGTQEIQPDQVTSFDVATQGAYSFYPGNTMGYAGATQSIMWREADWEFVWGSTISMPFMHQSRPQALVRLRNRASGAEVYMMNVHLSPGKMEDDRKKALNIIVAAIKQLDADGLPIMLTGDFNEHRDAFCKVVGSTNLEAAQGGTHNGSCKPPKNMRVDWVFGSRGTFSGTAIDQSNRVRRATDHAVISSKFSVQ